MYGNDSGEHCSRIEQHPLSQGQFKDAWSQRQVPDTPEQGCQFLLQPNGICELSDGMCVFKALFETIANDETCPLTTP